jgi:hypothetical protein
MVLFWWIIMNFNCEKLGAYTLLRRSYKSLEGCGGRGVVAAPKPRGTGARGVKGGTLSRVCTPTFES